MKTTLSYNRMLLNVKELAPAGLSPASVPDGALAIIDVTTNQTVAPANFEELPKKFRLMHKFDGKITYGFDCIEKKNIVWSQEKEYVAPVANKWEGVVEHCNCIDVVKLNIFVQSDILSRAAGLPWGTSDFALEVSPEEMKCYCSCEDTKTYQNNVLTMLIYKQLALRNSPFYTATVETVGGTKFNTLAEVEEFVKNNKEVNTDEDKGNDGELLKLVLEARTPAHPKRFNPYNRISAYPAGTAILPSFVVNGETVIRFTELQAPVFEVGAGYNLVEEEWDNYSYYNNVGSYPRYRNDHSAAPELQFEEGKKYDTVTFEFDTPKQNRAGEADHKRFLMVLGSEMGLRSDVFDKLKEIFNPA